MSADSVVTRRDGGVIIATLNRPDRLNALNKDIFDDLESLLDVLETDKSARVLILTSAGDKSFCVGADLKERSSMNEKDILLRFEVVKAIYRRMESLPIPIIAAMNGTALGGGLELALACDLRVAVEGANMGLPEVDLAIIPGNGGTQRLPRLIGQARALELILLAKKITSQEALAMGLVHAVVPVGQSLNTAKSWAAKIQESGPIAIRQAKHAIRQGMERVTLEQGLTLETESYKNCLYSKDRMEGLRAFSEKRKPTYRGE